MSEIKGPPGKEAKFAEAIKAVRAFKERHPSRDDVFIARRISAIELLGKQAPARPKGITAPDEEAPMSFDGMRKASVP